MRQKTDKPIFIIYILGFLILTLSVAWSQPLANTPPLYGNPPDEHARYLVPKYICEHGVLPTGFEEEIRIDAYGFSYGLYNVFPYIVQGYVMRFVDLFTDSEVILLYSARTVNVLFGVLMATVVYLLSKRLFEDRRFRWLFCFVIMYMPQSLFMHTYVNTDSCCLLSTAMMVYALVRSYQEGFNRKNNLWMSGGIILCALSYYNAYGYILSCILLLLAYFFEKKDGRISYNYKEMLKNGLFISVVVLLGIGWWFIRSYIVLDGDILGLATREKMSIEYGIPEVNPENKLTYQSMGFTVWEMMKQTQLFDGTFLSFVAAFGSMTILGNIWLYRGYKLLLGAGVLGCLYYIFNRKERSKIDGKKIFFHINMLFCILMPILLMVYYAYTMDFQNQGRYVLPCVIPLMYYVVKGIEQLKKLHWKQYKLPGWLVNLGVIFCFTIVIIGTIHMIYFVAMPIYREIGMVL